MQPSGLLRSCGMEPDVNNLILRLRFVPNMDINLQPEELVTSKAQQ